MQRGAAGAAEGVESPADEGGGLCRGQQAMRRRTEGPAGEGRGLCNVQEYILTYVTYTTLSVSRIRSLRIRSLSCLPVLEVAAIKTSHYYYLADLLHILQ